MRIDISKRTPDGKTVAMAAIALKFMIFPLHDGRTYLPMLLPALLMMLAETRDQARVLAGRLNAGS